MKSPYDSLKPALEDLGFELVAVGPAPYHYPDQLFNILVKNLIGLSATSPRPRYNPATMRMESSPQVSRTVPVSEEGLA